VSSPVETSRHERFLKWRRVLLPGRSRTGSIAAVKRSLLSLLAVAATFGATLAEAGTSSNPQPPAVRVKDDRFGFILQSRNELPLYYWNREKAAGGKIRCTGRCARVWPPLIVKSRSAVPRRMANVKGTFGVVKRSDGRLQVTFRGLPLYAYHDDPPNTVLCNNVDGWFVVRV
jgi:predicted lipoprotein with Yx(FWY)xxD motif